MAAFRLARILGKTIGELKMSWREFLHWQAYLAMEPPEAAANRRNAALLATIINMSGKILPDGQRVSVAELLGELPRQQTMEEQIAFMRSLG